MDNELLNSLIETVVNDKDRTNNYIGFDQLLLTLSDEEIKYFLVKCKSSLFLNVKLGYLLVETIPIILKEHVINYVNGLLNDYEQAIMEISNNDPEYNKKIKNLITKRKKVERFQKIYLDEINNKLNNK